MTIEDYIQKQRDITYLKLSREVQDVNFEKIILLFCFYQIFFVFKYLANENYDAKKQKEIQVLEQTLTYQTKVKLFRYSFLLNIYIQFFYVFLKILKQFEKVYGLKARTLKDVNYQSVKVANQNDKLTDKLIEKNVALHERKHINEEMSIFRFFSFK